MSYINLILNELEGFEFIRCQDLCDPQREKNARGFNVLEQSALVFLRLGKIESTRNRGVVFALQRAGHNIVEDFCWGTVVVVQQVARHRVAVDGR